MMTAFEMDAWEEGIEEGIEEGRLEVSISVAKKLIARGKYSLEEIADLTELSLETVEILAEAETA